MGPHSPVAPCNHQEADSRICLHVKHSLKNDSCNVFVRTVDTDVVVLLISSFSDFKAQQPNIDLWVSFGMGKSYHFNINSIYDMLGPEKSLALAGFHAFSRCDTTSQL